MPTASEIREQQDLLHIENRCLGSIFKELVFMVKC